MYLSSISTRIVLCFRTAAVLVEKGGCCARRRMSGISGRAQVGSLSYRGGCCPTLSRRRVACTPRRIVSAEICSRLPSGLAPATTNPPLLPRHDSNPRTIPYGSLAQGHGCQRQARCAVYLMRCAVDCLPHLARLPGRDGDFNVSLFPCVETMGWE